MNVIKHALVFGLVAIGCHSASAQGAKRLPFADGTYVTDAAICRMTEDQRVARFGDQVGSMVRNIEGSQLDNSYELSCKIGSVKVSGSSVRFRANCESEGEPNTINGSWTRIDDRSFKIGNRTFTACGRLIR